MTIRLASLLSEVDVLEVIGDARSTDVAAVTQDSAAVVDGALYCCIKGRHTDGHDLAQLVVDAGARSLLVERVVGVDVCQVRVASTREATSSVAAAFFGHPSDDLAVVGVTGTNGKTTTVHLLAAVAEAAGRPAGTIGTLSGVRTTPEAPVLQATLARFRDEGKEVVAMEASSMALDQHRTDSVSFAVAVWTNLTQDHLDYHETMEAYFLAKARLFEAGRSAVAVVNTDDDWGRRLAAGLDIPVRPFGLADATDLEVGLASSRFRWRGEEMRLRLGGIHNVSNALAAATAAEVLGMTPAQIAAGLGAVAGVPGRFEAIDAGQPFSVIVDYAHTPDGLEQVLGSVAGSIVPPGRVTIVFGAGGDRDRSKRPLMAAAATRMADRVVLTSDNPRGEDPLAIIAGIAAGAVRGEVITIEPDRAAAIALALSEARPGDVVLIAGKGHETGQVIGETVFAFDDRDVARQALHALGWASQDQTS